MNAKEIGPLILGLAKKWHVHYSFTPKGDNTVNTVLELSIITDTPLTEEEQDYFESIDLDLYDIEDDNGVLKYHFSQALDLH